MKKIELLLNDDIIKELQKMASIKGISLEDSASKVLESYTKRYVNMEKVQH